MQKEQKQNLTAESTPPQNQGKFKRLISAFKARAGYFFNQTFRRHTKDEYRAFFSRGYSDTDKVNQAYPWVYSRALCVLFLLFAFVVFVLVATSNTLAYPTVLLLGGIFMNIPLVICLYELYPKRDFKLSTLFIVMIIGGVISVSLAELGYSIYNAGNNEWFSPFWTGILEEFSKAVVAIAAILLLKQRKPYVCFLIGAAVGTGFSISEDMGYAFVYAMSSSSYAGIDIQYGIAVALARAVISLCTHTMWTALIGWAFAKFKKPFINPKFWGIAIYSILLHSVWDFTLNEVAMVFIRIGLAVLVAVPVILIVKKERQGDIPVPLRKQGEQLTISPENLSAKYAHKANLDLVMYIVAAALFFIASVCVPYGTKNQVVHISSEQEFVLYMQNGVEYESDWFREYDETTEDYAYAMEEGFKTQSIQKVESGGYTYYYYYYFTKPDDESEEQSEDETDDNMSETQQGGESIEEVEETEEADLPSQILLEIDGKKYYCQRVKRYGGAYVSEDAADEYLCFYWINSDVIGWSKSGYSPYMSFTITLSAKESYGYPAEIILLVCMSLCFIGGVISFIYYKKKAKKLEKCQSAQDSQGGDSAENLNKTETVDKGGSDKKE